jgi:nucleoside-diphosphate-sugar epimerase
MTNLQETVFVTGSTGFIGKNVVQYLQDRYDIIAPKHKELDLLAQNDVNRIFKDYDIDYVIHCANIGGTRKNRDAWEILDKNLRIFFNIVENQHRFKKIIHLGSGAEYNKDCAPARVTEEYFGKHIPIDEYGFSKYIMSKYIEKSQKIYCLRLFGIFGRYEDYEFKFISNAILKNLLHMPINIRQNVFFDWLYIDDLLHILDYFLINDPAYRVYNITTGVTTDLVSICKIINSLSDFESEIIVENEGLNLEYSGDNRRFLHEIDDFQFKSMGESIKDLRDYYKEILHEINAESICEDKYAKYCKIKPCLPIRNVNNDSQ